MFALFEFENGSNPYIAKNNKTFFKMICKYDYENINFYHFRVRQERSIKPKTYTGKKELVRELAIELYDVKSCFAYDDLVVWQEFFSEYGKRFGLLKEFHENGIC